MSIRRALFKFRILPLTVLSLTGLFSMKAYEVYKGTEQLSALLAGEAIASSEEKPSAAQSAAKEAQKPESDAEEKAADAKEPSPTDALSKDKDKTESEEITQAEDAETGDAAVASEGEEGASEEAKTQDVADAKPEEDDKKQYSQVELDILQSLSKRRDELNQWENDIKLKENLLSATEQRINDKIGEIKSLEGSVRKLLSQYNDHEDSKIRSLVKIYENMKPKDAAQIFNEMEMPILLEVVDKMSERKAAPILAQMDPKKAKEVTVQLAEQRKLFVRQQQALDQMGN